MRSLKLSLWPILCQSAAGLDPGRTLILRCSYRTMVSMKITLKSLAFWKGEYLRSPLDLTCQREFASLTPDPLTGLRTRGPRKSSISLPNWRFHDSPVRLLSAILAAHPDLNLNYH